MSNNKVKKILSLFVVLGSSHFLYACPSPGLSPVYSSPSAYESQPQSAPVALAQPTPSNVIQDLNSLRAGVLPDTSYTDAERKLAGFLVRKTIPVFPLKIGVLLYRDAGVLADSDRRQYFDSFLNSLRADPNVGQVIEVSSNLIAKGADIEEIRKLGARFQISSVMVISETYQAPQENKEAVVTPIDLIDGSRTWQSYTNIEVYGLDILNGVFLFSTASGNKESNKYNRNSSVIKNPDNLLIKNSASKAWKNLESKVTSEVDSYHQRFIDNKVLPIILDPTLLPSPTPTTINAK